MYTHGRCKLPHALPPGEDVQLSRDRFLVGNCYRNSGDPMNRYNIVRIVSGFVADCVCTCRVTEAMTTPELMNCLTTVAAMLLNVPRISITIKCRRQTDSPQEAVATVVINKMSTWTEEYDELYDARFDSDLVDDWTYFNDGLFPCLFCFIHTVLA